MEYRDKYIFTEFLFTFFLLFVIVLLFGEALLNYELYLTLALIAGFSFSWFNRNKQNSLLTVFIGMGAFGVCVWLIYSLLNSSFAYQEIILIFIKAGIILEIILAFDCRLASSLMSIQALSLPLFMSISVFIKDYDIGHTILIVIYFISWALILKIKFYGSFSREKRASFKGYHSFFLPSIFFFTIIITSWTVFNRFSLQQIETRGILAEGKTVSIREDAIEKEYYDLQDKVQKEISNLIANLEDKQGKQEILYLLTLLINESLDIMEVEKAEQGLIDYLKRPGPGLEKQDAAKELSVLIKAYVDKKVLLFLKRTKDDIINNLKNNPFNIREKIAILSRINNIKNSNSDQEIRQYEKEAKNIINNSSVDINVKEELTELIKKFSNARALALHRRGMDSFLNDKEEGKLQPLAQRIKAIITKDTLIDILLKISLLFVLSIFALLIALYYITERKKNKLKLSLEKNPQDFIINLYENANAVVTIFGLSYSGFLPPLSYAKLVDDKYSGGDDLFFRFAKKFEEAKYSRHILKSQDALLTLNEYNNFLRILLSHYNKLNVALKYCFALLQRRPLLYLLHKFSENILQRGYIYDIL